MKVRRNRAYFMDAEGWLIFIVSVGCWVGDEDRAACTDKVNSSK